MDWTWTLISSAVRHSQYPPEQVFIQLENQMRALVEDMLWLRTHGQPQADPVAHRRTARKSLQNRLVDTEFVAIGDEHGLQGRFHQSVGQVVGSENIAVKFGGFKSADIASVYPGYTLTPEVALISTDPVDIDQIKAHSGPGYKKKLRSDYRRSIARYDQDVIYTIAIHYRIDTGAPWLVKIGLDTRPRRGLCRLAADEEMNARLEEIWDTVT
ncbi:hypothetical protein PENPOL_c002G08731 [Penicillium polonicum]|uniref:Uncharacterized protein n=1 Tax=Penicillium polonicum TaxID=60169 RepID=A0A1V6NZ98_PENPO|nr:hypothetical protein PENPOL_c002G08731 [Penicillium polonicum]